MSNLSSIARPYALAAFDSAREKQQLPAWKSFLESAAFMARQPSVVKVLANPEVSSARLFDLFHGVLSSLVDSDRENFLRLVAQNNRLNALPEISDLFNVYYATLEKHSKVRVVTAIEASPDFIKKLTQSLSKRIQREVTLLCEIDPAIIGGAVIHIGDRVIDGSIRGKLTRLLDRLTG
jgi:F-type H+-transporting ATPase subunit delta